MVKAEHVFIPNNEEIKVVPCLYQVNADGVAALLAISQVRDTSIT